MIMGAVTIWLPNLIILRGGGGGGGGQIIQFKNYRRGVFEVGNCPVTPSPPPRDTPESPKEERP